MVLATEFVTINFHAFLSTLDFVVVSGAVLTTQAQHHYVGPTTNSPYAGGHSHSLLRFCEVSRDVAGPLATVVVASL